MRKGLKLLTVVMVMIFCLATVSTAFAADNYDGMEQLKKNVTEKDSEQKGSEWVAQYRIFADGKWEEWTSMVNMAYDGALYAKGADGSQPQIGVNEKGVFIAGGQWNQDNVWKNEGALTFIAPKAGTINLHGASGLDQFIAGDIDANTKALKACKGIVTIYKNSTKVWPENKDYAELTSEKSLAFPKLEIEVAKGDMIRIAVSGAALKDGEQNADWQTHIVFQPVAEYKVAEVKNTETTTTTTTETTTTTSDESSENPKTGDFGMIPFIIGAGVSGVGAVTVLRRRKK